MKTLTTLIFLAGTATVALAGPTAAPVPEIDANSVAAAVALVSGGLLVLRGRRKK
jgi:LPXTG-motif cell wall-anchored protein